MTPFTEAWQWFSFGLFRWGAPHLDEPTAKQKWRSLYNSYRAFTNGHGFEDRETPYADFVNGVDEEAELPAFHQPLVCSGATITGKESGSWLIVETLDGSKPPPGIDEIKNKPWLFFEALSIPGWIDRDKPRPLAPLEPFPQGYPNTLVPLISKVEVKYELARLEKLPLGSNPADPYYFEPYS